MSMVSRRTKRDYSLTHVSKEVRGFVYYLKVSKYILVVQVQTSLYFSFLSSTKDGKSDVKYHYSDGKRNSELKSFSITLSSQGN